MGPQVQPKCFRHLQHIRNNWELRKQGYLIRFGHTEALLLKKKDIKRPFFPPCRNWPIYVIFPSWKVQSLPKKNFEKYTVSSIKWPLTVLIRGLVWVKMASRKNTASPKYISTWSTFCDVIIIATKHLKSCLVGWVQLRFSRNKLRWDDKSNAGQNRAQ